MTKGRIPKESQEILTQVGEWMEQNGESLYECGISEYDKPEWGRYTQKETRYMPIFMKRLWEHSHCMESARRR